MKKLLCLALLGFIFGCKTKPLVNNAVVSQESTYHKFSDKENDTDQALLKLIQPYKDSVAQEMNQVIGTLNADMDKQKPNSALGNWLADALHEEGERIFEREMDFAIQNHGGIRIPTLAKGNITKGNIFELMPFDNSLMMLELDSSTVQKLCDRIAAYGGWPISFGLSFTIVDGKSKDIMIGGNALDASRNYFAAIPDYVANGGDDCFFLSDAPSINSNVYIREILIANVAQLTEEGTSIIANHQIRIKE